jgi:phytanoyl-CoA dioxygenase PhyH
MHRTRTRFAPTVERLVRGQPQLTRLGERLQNRGIRATYELHDRALSNRSSRRRFAADHPVLDDVQSRIVSDLERDGYSLLTFAELLPHDWAAISAQADAFVSKTEQALASDSAAFHLAGGKDYLVRWSQGSDRDVDVDNAWFRVCASRRMLDIANTYLGLWSKLEYVDLWYSIPEGPEAARKQSQRWHRDFNDKHLVKAFLYLVDVDQGTGPFQYIPGTAPGGRFADAWPWRPSGHYYPPESELETRIPKDEVKTFVGPKGTLLFCNTSGFHRGGFATDTARVLATCTYLSPASLASLTDRSYRFVGSLEALDAPTRFALGS